MNLDQAHRIAALVLAAGASTRMGGQHKLLRLIDGVPMVRHAVAAALGARCAPVLVVTGGAAAAIEAALVGEPVSIVRNAEYAHGLSTSLHRGLAALPPDTAAVVILLADMPRVRAAHIDRIIAAFDPAHPRIVVPLHGGRRGHPVLWPRCHFAALHRIVGDTGGRTLLDTLHGDLITVAFDTDAVLTDVDTPADLAALSCQQMRAPRSPFHWSTTPSSIAVNLRGALMQNFTFHNPTRILFGTGQIAAMNQEIPAGARVLITYGGGSVVKTGTLAEVKAALTDFTLLEFGGIEPNPTYETLMQAVALARREQVDFLLAVGGGSVIDGTKFIAAAIPFDGEPWDMLAKQAPITAAVPFGTVLTLPATGSEMNSFAVITRAATQDKLAFGHPLVFPRFSVLDPTKTYTLPPRQVANGVIDAFVHIAEQYLTYPDDAKVQDRFAEGLLLTLIEDGPKALTGADTYAVRANLMWTATLALNGLIGAGVPQDWATHMIGHEITALHGLDHAQTLAIVLPAMLQIRRRDKRAKLLQYAARIWDLHDGDEDARIDTAIRRTRDFFESLQVPTRLSSYGIGPEAITPLVQALERHGMTALGERKNVDLEQSRQVLALAC